MIKQILSYYSEIDYADNRFNGIDGLYEVEYPNNINLKIKIQKAYRELLLADINVNKLSVVLDYLLNQQIIFNYKYLKTEMFNCDYGDFKEV